MGGGVLCSLRGASNDGGSLYRADSHHASRKHAKNPKMSRCTRPIEYREAAAPCAAVRLIARLSGGALPRFPQRAVITRIAIKLRRTLVSSIIVSQIQPLQMHQFDLVLIWALIVGNGSLSVW